MLSSHQFSASPSSACLSVSLSVWISVGMPVYMPGCISVSLSLSLACVLVCYSARLLSVYLRCLSACSVVCPLPCFCACLVYLSVCLHKKLTDIICRRCSGFGCSHARRIILLIALRKPDPKIEILEDCIIAICPCLSFSPKDLEESGGAFAVCFFSIQHILLIYTWGRVKMAQL